MSTRVCPVCYTPTDRGDCVICDEEVIDAREELHTQDFDDDYWSSESETDSVYSTESKRTFRD